MYVVCCASLRTHTADNASTAHHILHMLQSVLHRAHAAGVQVLAYEVVWRGGQGSFGRSLPIYFANDIERTVDEEWLAKVIEADGNTDNRPPPKGAALAAAYHEAKATAKAAKAVERAAKMEAKAANGDSPPKKKRAGKPKAQKAAAAAVEAGAAVDGSSSAVDAVAGMDVVSEASGDTASVTTNDSAVQPTPKAKRKRKAAAVAVAVDAAAAAGASDEAPAQAAAVVVVKKPRKRKAAAVAADATAVIDDLDGVSDQPAQAAPVAVKKPRKTAKKATAAADSSDAVARAVLD
jgi:hypothetical protein